MNQKSLLKKMSIVVASAAMMVTALPLTASAASYKSGDYTASVNFYVPKAQAPQNLYNAYLNDTAIPPKNAATNNVTVHISSAGVITFKLPINNTQLGIKTLGTAEGVTAKLEDAGSTNCTKHPGTRYNTLEASVETENDGNSSISRTFKTSALHAKITKELIGGLTITPYDNDFEANPVLQIDLPSDAITK